MQAGFNRLRRAGSRHMMHHHHHHERATLLCVCGRRSFFLGNAKNGNGTIVCLWLQLWLSLARPDVLAKHRYHCCFSLESPFQWSPLSSRSGKSAQGQKDAPWASDEISRRNFLIQIEVKETNISCSWCLETFFSKLTEWE